MFRWLWWDFKKISGICWVASLFDKSREMLCFQTMYIVKVKGACWRSGFKTRKSSCAGNIVWSEDSSQWFVELFRWNRLPPGRLYCAINFPVIGDQKNAGYHGGCCPTALFSQKKKNNMHMTVHLAKCLSKGSLYLWGSDRHFARRTDVMLLSKKDTVSGQEWLKSKR